MKQNNRIWIYTLLAAGLFILLAISCEKDENLSDYASIIAGTYNGTVTVEDIGTVACTSILTKSSDQEVDLEITIGSNSIPLKGIDVSSSGGDIYDLKYTDRSGSFTGKVEGNNLTWTLAAMDIVETFSGTK